MDLEKIVNEEYNKLDHVDHEGASIGVPLQELYLEVKKRLPDLTIKELEQHLNK